MTYSLNGIGTSLAGKRRLTQEEYHQCKSFIPREIDLKEGKRKKHCHKCNKFYSIRQKCPECGRALKKVEYFKRYTHLNYKIATESFVFLFLPLFPLKTFVYADLNSGGYIPLFYPKGEGKVYWEHVKSSWSFYIAPAIVIILLIYYLFSFIT